MTEDFTDANGKGENDAEDDDEEWRFAVVLDGHDSEVKSVAWSAGGNFIATCSRDKSVWIWEEVDDDNNFETIAVLQEHDGDVKCVAWHPQEELLASASYDDTIRIWREDVDDWGCVSVLKGHDSTVWTVDWESPEGPLPTGLCEEEQQRWKTAREASGPRLMSCSDDLSIRLWRRKPKPKNESPFAGGTKMPSIIRPANTEETWFEVGRLPRRHELPVYSIAWSKKTGRVVSAGGDGRIIVYEERAASTKEPTTAGNPPGSAMDGVEQAETGITIPPTEWAIVAEIEAAHDVYEINHICWAKRADRAKRSDDEEIIVSTADDGSVKTWTLDLP